MPESSTQLMAKADVAQRLSMSERTLEKLVKARKFPPPLKLGKHALWSQEVVERWLTQALMPQLQWEAPKRVRASIKGP